MGGQTHRCVSRHRHACMLLCGDGSCSHHCLTGRKVALKLPVFRAEENWWLHGVCYVPLYRSQLYLIMLASGCAPRNCSCVPGPACVDMNLCGVCMGGQSHACRHPGQSVLQIWCMRMLWHGYGSPYVYMCVWLQIRGLYDMGLRLEEFSGSDGPLVVIRVLASTPPDTASGAS